MTCSRSCSKSATVLAWFGFQVPGNAAAAESPSGLQGVSLLAAGELGPVEPGVVAVRSQQVLVGSLLNDPSVVHDQN